METVDATSASASEQRQQGMLQTRVVGPDDWAHAHHQPVPVRLVRTVQSGIGIGIGIWIAMLLLSIPLALLIFLFGVL